MNDLLFEWDQNKNEQNQKKHGISFEEARTVFFDENAVEFFDEDHSDWEDRFLLLGLSSRFRILMICHCFREEDSIIRVISARKATRNEQEYDISKMKRRKNPYAKRLKKQVTIRMGVDIIEYFKEMSVTTGIPYQNLINLYLRDCVQSGRKLQMEWSS
jgi:hypothetical protein